MQKAEALARVEETLCRWLERQLARPPSAELTPELSQLVVDQLWPEIERLTFKVRACRDEALNLADELALAEDLADELARALEVVDGSLSGSEGGVAVTCKQALAHYRAATSSEPARKRTR